MFGVSMWGVESPMYPLSKLSLPEISTSREGIGTVGLSLSESSLRLWIFDEMFLSVKGCLCLHKRVAS